MALPKQKFRELAFQLFYSLMIGTHEESEAHLVSTMMAELKATRHEVEAALKLVKKIQAQVKELDRRIAKVSEEYRLERIASVELNIIRLAAYELFYGKDVPPAVAIAEGIRLCRKFSTHEAAQFVNAILDALRKESAHDALESDSE